MARFCNICNSPIEDGGCFCTECGSSDIRDIDMIEKLDEDIPSLPIDENGGIPEITDEAVSSFGVKSIENLQKSEIKPISNSQTDILDESTEKEEKEEKKEEKEEKEEENKHDENEEKDTSFPQKEEEPTHQFATIPTQFSENQEKSNTNSFADVPDYMSDDSSTQQTIAVPKDFQLQDGGTENDYAQTASAAQATSALAERRKLIQKRRRKKAIKKAIIIIVIIAVIIFGGLFLYYYGKAIGERDNGGIKPFSSGDLPAGGGDTFDYSTIFTPENSFRVGEPKYGYISIPKTWAQIEQVDGNPALQYTDNTSLWVVTLMSVSTSLYSASDYANNVYSQIQAGGGQNITTGKATISNYPALTITAYYPNLNKYLTTWCFESVIGQTHYLAIEGPAPSGDNYNIIYSFKIDK